MTRNQDIGKHSEEYVAQYLERRGARILARNYSVHNVGEIDIICVYKEKILVIEVKSRDFRTRYGTPEESVTKSKQQKIMRTMLDYCRENDIRLECVSYYVAGVIHDEAGRILNVQFTSFI
ncbi:MAG TPA: YraN family protein [Clostridiales bacterium]|nr:YraN family protein [Clostridiales bacterium]